MSDAPSSGSMWADMLGLGPLMQTVQDPNFQAHLRSIVQAVLDTNARCARIEAMLSGRDSNERIPSGSTSPVPAKHGTNGDGRPTATGGVTHDGDIGNAPTYLPLGVSNLP